MFINNILIGFIIYMAASFKWRRILYGPPGIISVCPSVPICLALSLLNPISMNPGNHLAGCLPDFSIQIQGLQGPFSHFKPGFRGHFLLFVAIFEVQFCFLKNFYLVLSMQLP